METNNNLSPDILFWSLNTSIQDFDIKYIHTRVLNMYTYSTLRARTIKLCRFREKRLCYTCYMGIGTFALAPAQKLNFQEKLPGALILVTPETRFACATVDKSWPEPLQSGTTYLLHVKLTEPRHAIRASLYVTHENPCEKKKRRKLAWMLWTLDTWSYE